MTTEEMSNQFDTLINVYSQNYMFGTQDPLVFDEYEKSVFLTEAQEQLVISLYDGKNDLGNVFELTEEDRRYLSDLVKTATIEPNTNTSNIHIIKNSKFFQLPNDLMFITYESVKLESKDDSCINNKVIKVQPVTQDEFHKIKENPFRGANDNRALRLDIEGNVVEIVSNQNIKEYLVRYVKRPSPIVLVDLQQSSLSIEGEKNITGSEVNPILHSKIVNYAVRLALQSKSIGRK